MVALKHAPYNDALDLAGRLEALTWLCDIVGGGLGVRNLLDAREKEVAALKKQLLEDARVGGREGGFGVAGAQMLGWLGAGGCKGEGRGALELRVLGAFGRRLGA